MRAENQPDQYQPDLALIVALTPVDVTNGLEAFDKIKYALNVTLDPAISATVLIFCNQSGIDLMDQLDDGVGRPILQPYLNECYSPALQRPPDCDHSFGAMG